MPEIVILSYFLIWFAGMFSSALYFYRRPLTCFNPDSFFFRERSWEAGGKFYEKVFFIKYWKKLLPDGAALFKNGFRKRKLTSASPDYLDRFIRETCRAEATHLPPLFLPIVFALYNPPHIVLIMVVFGLLTNMPCLLAQRYNRIRLRRLCRLIQASASVSSDAEVGG